MRGGVFGRKGCGLLFRNRIYEMPPSNAYKFQRRKKSWKDEKMPPERFACADCYTDCCAVYYTICCVDARPVSRRLRALPFRRLSKISHALLKGKKTRTNRPADLAVIRFGQPVSNPPFPKPASKICPAKSADDFPPPISPFLQADNFHNLTPLPRSPSLRKLRTKTSSRQLRDGGGTSRRLLFAADAYPADSSKAFARPAFKRAAKTNPNSPFLLRKRFAPFIFYFQRAQCRTPLKKRAFPVQSPTLPRPDAPPAKMQNMLDKQ